MQSLSSHVLYTLNKFITTILTLKFQTSLHVSHIAVAAIVISTPVKELRAIQRRLTLPECSKVLRKHLEHHWKFRGAPIGSRCKLKRDLLS